MPGTHPRRSLAPPPRLCAVWLALAILAAAPRTALAQDAATLYQRAESQAVRALIDETPSLDALRRAARAYEAVVLRYPTSGYCDNALWEAASLMQRAFALSAEPADRDASARYLSWLKREYPGSALGRKPLPAPANTPERASATPSTARPTAAQQARSAPPEPPAATRASLVAVRSITHAILPRGERLTIELADEVAYTGERVSNPDRVFFDFSNAASASALADRIRGIQSPLIKTVRVGTPKPGVTRVVLELTGAPKYSAFPMYGPFRLVVDLETDAAPSTSPASPTTPTLSPTPTPIPTATPTVPQTVTPAVTPVSTPTPTPAAPPPAMSPAKTSSSPPATKPAPVPSPAPPSSTTAGDYSLARQLGLRVARVVIDPGHGGHDPGAQANGVTEAELVLDVALRLEKLLQAAGMEVVLTRRTSEFIPLEERTAIANRENADLFLSIHANAHRQTAVRGVETYFLNFASNPEAEAVAARENATSTQTMGSLPTIVKAIALNNKLAESREFAGMIQTQLARRLRAQSSGVKDLGVKQAPFVVLIGAQMPSVLTEVAFLTNKSEASLLKQASYRQHMAQALRDAIVRYRDSLKKVTTVAERQESR